MSQIIQEPIDILVNGEKVDYRGFLLDADGYGGMTAVHIRILEKLIPGCTVQYLDGKVIVNIPGDQQPQILDGWIIGIDPGHGGTDPGACDGVNPAEGDVFDTKEAYLTMMVANTVIAGLIAKGATVVATRTGNDSRSLDERCTILNNAKCHIDLSIHFDSAVPAAKGIGTFCMTGSIVKGSYGFKLAKYIQEVAVLETGLVDRGVKEANFQMLRETNAPAALIECGFITNPEEEKVIVTDVYIQKIGQAITRGLTNFCLNNSVLKNR